MTEKELLSSISKETARRFLLMHHFMLPAKSVPATRIVEDIFTRLGCIQFDTISVVGRNADLALQARVKDYRPEVLENLLYEQRNLIDGWDKVASIYPAADWPHFHFQRERMAKSHGNRSNDAVEAAPAVLERVRTEGPLSSLDFKSKKKTEWFWAPTTVARAALELLYAQGKLGIHHRVNTRRTFDLIERLQPEGILSQPDAHASMEDYLRWHITRRIGGLGFASTRGTEHWYGIVNGMRVAERTPVIEALQKAGDILELAVSGVPRTRYYLRKEDLDRLRKAEGNIVNYPDTITFIAPLDNLMWDRKTIREVFEFEYVWEVYKPMDKREYGYYVLPILHRDRLIGRANMKFDRKTGTLIIKGWWWEPGIDFSDAMQNAVQNGLRDFMKYLGADFLTVNGGEKKKNATLNRLREIAMSLS